MSELLEPCPWCDSVFHWPQSRSKAGRQHEFLVLAGRLRKERFDLAVLLANSFRSALVARLSGISRRVGYDRDGRGLLLTDRLLPHRKDGKYVPVSMVRYYAGLARYLNCEVDENDLSLPLRPEDEQAAASLISWCGIGPGEKAVEGAVTNTIAGIEEPAPLSSVLLSSLEQALDSKPQAIEQAFLISPQKEPGPVGNEITF